MGIIGFGRIGRRTTVIAEALGMKVLAYGRYQDKDLGTDNCRYMDLEELLACSDVISPHYPLFPETEKIINRQTIAKMKKEVLIINAFRGGLVEEANLREGLDSGKVGGAAVDVVSTESIRKDNPPLEAKNILITPHIAWAPRESRQKLTDIVVENLIQFMTGTSQHVVNRPQGKPFKDKTIEQERDSRKAVIIPDAGVAAAFRLFWKKRHIQYGARILSINIAPVPGCFGSIRALELL